VRPAAVTALTAFAAFAVALAVACEPELSRRPSLVDEPRVLAVRGEPPEAKPGAGVAYDVLVVGPDGTHAPPRGGASWAFCATPRPPTENDAVAQACAAGAVRPIGTGAQVEAMDGAGLL